MATSDEVAARLVALMDADPDGPSERLETVAEGIELALQAAPALDVEAMLDDPDDELILEEGRAILRNIERASNGARWTNGHVPFHV